MACRGLPAPRGLAEFALGPIADSRNDVGIGRRSGSVSVEIRRPNPAGQSRSTKKMDCA